MEIPSGRSHPVSTKEPILVKNIFYMLSYAYRELNRGEYAHLDRETFDNIHSLFAAILSAGIGRQIKQGLPREYLETHGNLITVRGRVDIPATLRNRISQKQRISCSFAKLSTDNLANQVLAATAQLLLRHADVKEKQRQELKRALLFFSNVTPIDLRNIRWNTLILTSRNRSYRLLLSICRFVVEGMLPREQHGEYRLAKFLDDQEMSRLYEKFLLEYFRREHPSLQVNASQVPWALEPGADDTSLPQMRSDVTLTDTHGHTLIIDAKYYSQILTRYFNKNTFRSANLYQIFTYVKNYTATASTMTSESVVSGMLLYAKTDEQVPAESTWNMSGNTISVATLDLNQDFAEIRARLDGIVERFFPEQAAPKPSGGI